ncbi:hypothetical protein Afer_1785 [Acidimicrobium ferrooxidans DSM 10331]|uniref:Uncharacterized protein n=1 Tax=Acidimicrobium ferrooxidans (strain DSM 10331 / JCM 15462 / NBRC 103882 / ICP) TaxID=525909 RepID=C7M151_ACIFD|nr:hypothetical protein [Acidimicrobium ferrooxidans]ACU54699.1 hypothetical protein Afer_1785 [Acidimicrobium ferrooxidans DSM 10331]
MSLLEALRQLSAWDLTDADTVGTVALVIAAEPTTPPELTSALRLLVAHPRVGVEVLALANRVLGVIDPLEEAYRAGIELADHLESCGLHGRGGELAVGPTLVARRGVGPSTVETCTWRLLPDELVRVVANRHRARLFATADLAVLVDGRRILPSRYGWPRLAPGLAQLEGGADAVEA